VSTYVDPADRVAASKATADDIKTWPVSEVDKKGKKKKGTLGVGNGAVFFASESDKVRDNMISSKAVLHET
jgi:actin cytoskeleton-regulatory complex protein SLA1